MNFGFTEEQARAAANLTMVDECPKPGHTGCNGFLHRESSTVNGKGAQLALPDLLSNGRDLVWRCINGDQNPGFPFMGHQSCMAVTGLRNTIQGDSVIPLVPQPRVAPDLPAIYRRCVGVRGAPRCTATEATEEAPHELSSV